MPEFLSDLPKNPHTPPMLELHHSYAVTTGVSMHIRTNLGIRTFEIATEEVKP